MANGDLPIHPRRSGYGAMVIAAVVFAVLSSWAGASGPGFLEADGCTHYQYSRFVFDEPYRLIDVWGRPWCTFVYAGPVALARRAGAHGMSLAMALGMAWLTWRIARRQHFRWPALAFIFVLAQPLVFLHSFSELTELPFGLLLACAFLAYRERRWWELALVAGAMPLARPEGFGFLAMAAAALVLHRRSRWLPLLVAPLLVWNYGGWELSGRSGEFHTWLVRNWPYAATSLYDPGPLLHFVALLPAVVGPFIFPAVAAGSWAIARQTSWALRMSHRQRCQGLILVIPLLILAGHSYLYWRGKMASNGELRYMLVVAPMWGLLAARGWEWIFWIGRWTHPLRWAAVAALLPVWIQIPKIGYPCLPLEMSQDWVEAAEIGRWYAHWPLQGEYPYLMNSHPGVPYSLDMNPTDPGRTRWWTQQEVDAAPAGTLLIWDPVYGVKSSDASRSVTEEEIRRAGWKEIAGPVARRDQYPVWRFFLSPRPRESEQGGQSRGAGDEPSTRPVAHSSSAEPRM